MDTTNNHTAARAAGVGEWGGQEFVRATVHLAGAVEIETGHAAHYSAAHVQARIGSALLYLLDYLAARDFAAAVAAVVARGEGLFSAGAEGLPPRVRHPGQEASVIVRLRGRQQIAPPFAVAASASAGRRAHVVCQLGGLVLVAHTGEALERLGRVADTVHRVAAVLWPQEARRVRDTGPDGGRDAYAEAWNRAHGLR